MEKSITRLLTQLGALIFQVDYRKNGRIEAGLGSLGFHLVHVIKAHVQGSDFLWRDSMFLTSILAGFDSLRLDYRISRSDQELMVYAYIRLREEAGMNPFDLPPGFDEGRV